MSVLSHVFILVRLVSEIWCLFYEASLLVYSRLQA